LELEDLYIRILSDIQARSSPESMAKTRAIYILVSGSNALGRPLQVEELWEAMAIPTHVDLSGENPIHNRRIFKRSWNDFRRQLRRQCGPLITMTKPSPHVDNTKRNDVEPHDPVQFIHRTVKDFFESRCEDGGLFFSEKEAIDEVKACARRYLEIVFPTASASYAPRVVASESDDWERDVDLFMRYLDSCILASFALEVWDPRDSNVPTQYRGRQGIVLARFLWPDLNNWTAHSAWGKFSEKLLYYPWIFRSTSAKEMVRTALLGEAIYASCRRGYVRATRFVQNLAIEYQGKHVDPVSKVFVNSATRAAIEAKLQRMTILLTHNDGHLQGRRPVRRLLFNEVRPNSSFFPSFLSRTSYL
jgi:hypothetical protein